MFKKYILIIMLSLLVLAMFPGHGRAEELNAEEAAVLRENSAAPDAEAGVAFEDAGYVMYAALDGLRLRTGPSDDFDVIGSFRYGEEVWVTGFGDNGWYRIELAANIVGYSDAQFLSWSPLFADGIENGICVRKKYTNFGNYGRLIIKDIDIDVALNLTTHDNGMPSKQAVTDWEDSACLFNRYPGYQWMIADHCHQNFATLSSSYVGCTGYIMDSNCDIKERIRCVETDIGFNDYAHGFVAGGGTPLETRYGGDHYAMYTCHGSEDVIFISYWIIE